VVRVVRRRELQDLGRGGRRRSGRRSDGRGRWDRDLRNGGRGGRGPRWALDGARRVGDSCSGRAVLVPIHMVLTVRVRPGLVTRRSGAAAADHDRDDRERHSQQAQDDSTSVVAHDVLQGSGGFRGLAKPVYCSIA